jgi:hypothetical protein
LCCTAHTTTIFEESQGSLHHNDKQDLQNLDKRVRTVASLLYIYYNNSRTSINNFI